MQKGGVNAAEEGKKRGVRGAVQVEKFREGMVIPLGPTERKREGWPRKSGVEYTEVANP